ncbi:MAG: GTP-binding protein [Nitrospira sp.]|nr:GTP-binding protein [Nitrospira sp.]
MRFWQFIQDEWPGVLRSKGYFWIASQPKTCYLWSQAGANCLYERLGRWWAAIPDRHWPKEETALSELRKVWDLEYGDRRIELAFIGDQMDRPALRRRLDECLLTRDELCLDEELWRAFRDPFKKASWEKRHGRSQWRHR